MADETSNTAVEQQKEESTPAPEVQKEVEKPVENGESTEAKSVEEEKQPEETKADGEAAGAEGAADDKPNETPAENPLEAPKENPFSDEDFEKLLSYADANEEGWEKMKNKHKGLTVYKRSDKAEKNGMSLMKGVFDLPNISFDRAVELFTDLEERRKWNKKVVSENLETMEDFRILYTTIKLPTPYTNRDMVQCTAVKKSEDPKQNAYIFKQCNHPNKPPKSNITRAELVYGGMLVKPGEEESSSQVIVINQINMKGWIPKPILHKLNNGYPSSLFEDLTSFLKKAAAAAEKEAQAEAAAAAAAAAAAESAKEGDKAEAKDGEKEGTEEPAAEPEKKEDEKKEENTAEQNGVKEEEAKTEETVKADTNGEAEEKKEEKTEEGETKEAS